MAKANLNGRSAPVGMRSYVTVQLPERHGSGLRLMKGLSEDLMMDTKNNFQSVYLK